MKSVLVALDESERAPLVFETAAGLARRLGARLSLLRVVVSPPDIPPAAHTPPDPVEGALSRAAEKQLRTLMATAPDVQFAPPVVEEGDPWHTIIETARRLDVDLIVVGSHGYRGLDRVLGTVSAKVVNHADRDVLVVHERRPAGKNP